MAPRIKKHNPNRIATRRNRNDVLLDTFLTLTHEIPKGCPSAQRPYYDGESFGLHEFCQLSGDETRKAWMVFDRGDEDSKIEFSVDYDVGTPTETTTFHRTARTPATAFQYAGYMAYWLEHGKFPKAPARSTRAPAKAKRLPHRNPATSTQTGRTGHVWRLTFDYGGSEDWPGITAERAAAAAAAHWQRTCGYVPEVVGASNVTRNPSPAGHVRVSLASPNGAVYWHGNARQLLRDEQGVTPTIVYSEPVWRWRMQQNPSSGAKQRARGSRDFHQGYGSRPDAAIGARYLQSAADLRASMAKTPAKRPGLLPWHKFDVESARFHRPKLPNPYSEGDFIADCAATGRQDAQNIYEDGNAYQTIPKLTAYMLERLNEEGDHPSFSQETLQAGARAWAETWLATSKAIAAKYAREYEMEENPSNKRRATSKRKPPATGWQKWNAGVYGLVRGGVIVAYVRAQGRVWKWEIPSRFGAIHWAKSLAAGKKAVVAALRQPTANPSSGAKQRARGVRNDPGSKGGGFLFSEFLAGASSKGARHEQYLNSLANDRRYAAAVKGQPREREAAISWAKGKVLQAARFRPALPNPSESQSPGVAHRLRGIENALADAINSGVGVLLVYHETPPPAGMYSQVRAMKGGPNRTRFCAPHHTITPGPALDAALNDARGGILFLDHVDDFIPAVQREIAAHAHECLIIATAPRTEHVVRQLQDVLAYRSI